MTVYSITIKDVIFFLSLSDNMHNVVQTILTKYLAWVHIKMIINIFSLTSTLSF